MASARLNQTRTTKARAILAGGLVLGVGAAVTLAAWTDDEFANGIFSAGTFVFQGSADGSDFSDNITAPGQSISFEVNPGTLSPGASVSGAYTVIVDESSTNAATVALSDDQSTAVAGLTYSVVETDGHGCGADAIGDTLVSDAALGSGASALSLGTFEIGEPRSFCFTVTADDALVQGSDGRGVWQFSATTD